MFKPGRVLKVRLDCVGSCFELAADGFFSVSLSVRVYVHVVSVFETLCERWCEMCLIGFCCLCYRVVCCDALCCLVLVVFVVVDLYCVCARCAVCRFFE